MAEETQVVEIDAAPFERMAAAMESVAERVASLEADIDTRITAAVNAAMPKPEPEPEGDPARRAGVLTGAERKAVDAVYVAIKSGEHS